MRNDSVDLFNMEGRGLSFVYGIVDALSVWVIYLISIAYVNSYLPWRIGKRYS